MEEPNLFVKTDDENAEDLTTLLIEIFNRNLTLQNSPLYIVAESYGGKFAVTLGLSALKAIESTKLKLILGGFSFPFFFLFSWWVFSCLYILLFLEMSSNFLVQFHRCCFGGFMDFTRRLCGNNKEEGSVLYSL